MSTPLLLIYTPPAFRPYAHYQPGQRCASAPSAISGAPVMRAKPCAHPGFVPEDEGECFWEYLVYYQLQNGTHGNIVIAIRNTDRLTAKVIEEMRAVIRRDQRLPKKAPVVICNVMELDPEEEEE